jgi:glutamate--cysteine ligase
MTAVPQTDVAVVTDKRDLVAWFEAGSKPADGWRIGTEHEKFAFTTEDLRPLPYDGPRGVRAMLEGLLQFGWKPVYEGENIIALVADSGCSISLEPGGQIELSGAPLRNIQDTCAEVHTHLDQVRHVGEKLGIAMIGTGFHPTLRRDEVPWMPKGRYGIMRAYMPKKGNLGLDMMLRTCTVQVNLDYGSEADMVRKFRVALALQPVATALFANSPFTEGKPNGFLSYRSHIWTDTDPDRTGMLPFAFEDGFGFERYTEYALDVPMYFVYRDGRYVDVAGQSFRDFLEGRLPGLPGERPTLGDWSNHLTTLFPEVRLKRFIEMRGADGGPWRLLCALPALWVGLLYDATALDAAWELVKDWTAEERQALRDAVPREGLHARHRNRTVRDIAHDVLTISTAGLQARARKDGFGRDERAFLEPLLDIVETGLSPAERKLEAYRTRWGGRIEPLFREHAY